MLKRIMSTSMMLGLVCSANAEEVKDLPQYNEEKVAVKADWLTVPVEQKAEVYRSEDLQDLILSNGLISRRFRISPNLATISLKHLGTQEEYLRSVRPEAIITLDGQRYDVGGLTGQSNHAFLKEEWISQMTSKPGAFQFTGFEMGETKAPFGWKRRPDWMGKDMPWPAPGKSLTLNFKATNVMIQSLLSSRITDMDKARKVLLQDDFTSTILDTEWKEFLSPKSNRSSFRNEGKPGEIMTLENCHTYVERKLPAGVKVMECRVDPGTDNSAGWGPGITAVWKNRTIKFYLRPRQNCFGVYDDSKVKLLAKIKKGQAYFLRLNVTPDKVICSASIDRKKWQQVHKIGGVFTSPTAVRLGKTSQLGKGVDHESSPGSSIRCRVDGFKAYGKLKENAPKELSSLSALKVAVHYEIYDGIPLICKWLTIENGSEESVMLDSFTAEQLAVVESESSVQNNPRWEQPNIHVVADMNFGGMDIKGANPAVNWEPDPLYSSQVNYKRKTPCLLNVRTPIGPAQQIKPGKSFTSFRVFELPQDSMNRERKGLGIRRMYRTIAPWISENPIFMHVKSMNPKMVKNAIDQCVEVGFEMVILTFGSGFSAENESEKNLNKLKELADYAHSKGIAIGGYSLLSSRSINKENNVVGVKPQFGNAPCICSKWGKNYFRKMYQLLKKTGMDIFEHDGSYPGDACRSTTHPGHKCYEDSQWNQWIVIRDYYRWCRENGIYLNIPDWYFLNGGSKCGMGYREVNWSLPRKEQDIHERQNIFDGTWNKTPSMGWMHVPLIPYHGGGAAASYEPLEKHLHDYEQRLLNLFGAGVQAAIRGTRLYDTDKTKAMVKKWTSWYKQHRAILDSDIIHLRRPDGRDIDYFLHVNPALEEKGMLMVYNPLDRPVKKTIKVPLYYAGLKEITTITDREGNTSSMKLNRDYSINLEVKIPANGTTWFIFKGE